MYIYIYVHIYISLEDLPRVGPGSLVELRIRKREVRQSSGQAGTCRAAQAHGHIWRRSPGDSSLWGTGEQTRLQGVVWELGVKQQEGRLDNKGSPSHH